jgi:dephospho-CoA kinase
VITPAVVAFSARQASGKSIVSTAVSEELGWARAGFGDYLRGLAASLGLSTEREVLQKIGERLVRDNLEQFCRDVLASGGWIPGRGIVLDGIRHSQTLGVLKDIVAPMPVILIYLDVPDLVRNERLRARGLPEDVARHHEQHSTEQQVIDTLPRLADLRVDASISVSSIKTEIISWIRERLVPRE